MTRFGTYVDLQGADKGPKGFRDHDIKPTQQVEAFDDAGNKFIKKVEIRIGAKQDEDKYGYCGKIISFGWPVEYYINQLLKAYPRTHNLCIDAGGYNHKGHAVYISKDDINRLLKPFYEEKQE